MITKLSALLKRNQSSQLIATSSRVYLREISISDAPFMRDLMNQKNWLTFIGDRNINSLADAEKHIETGPKRSYRVNGFGPYMVVDKNTQESIGICGLLKRTYLDSPDLGFAISERFYRQGYGFESAQLILQLADTFVDADYIYASVKKDNAGSCRLLEKLGFAIQVENIPEKIKNESDDLLLYKKFLSK